MKLADATVVTTAIPPRVRDGKLARAINSVGVQSLLPADHIVLVDNACEGPSALRNRALQMVRTTWTLFLDDDDEFLSHHVSTLMRHASADVDLVYPWFAVIGGTDPLGQGGRPFDADLLRRANYIPITYAVRTDLALAVGGFPLPRWYTPERLVFEDWGFLLALLDGGCRFAHVDEVTWLWHHHASNTSGRPWRGKPNWHPTRPEQTTDPFALESQ